MSTWPKAALPHLIAGAEAEPRRVTDLVNVSSVAGRRARADSAVHNLTKHGVGAFSEALRQEITRRHVRVSLVEPGAVSTELASHNRPEVQAAMKGRFADMERLEADDIADAISYIVPPAAPRRDQRDPRAADRAAGLAHTFFTSTPGRRAGIRVCLPETSSSPWS